MDPTQDQMETRRLMASVQEALDKIIHDFAQKRQDSGPAKTVLTRRS